MNKKNTYLPLLIITGILFSVFSNGCLGIDDSSEREASFRQAVDTIFNKRLQAFNDELDSICTVQTDSLIQKNIDSIKQVRLKEIERLKRIEKIIEK